MSTETNYCLKCLTVEKNCKCEPKRNIVSIDNNMINIITILNKKGYKTSFCCESHPLKYMPSLYILFKDDMSCLKGNLPKSFRIDTGNKRLIKFCMSIREKKDGLKDLIDWCVELPSFSELEKESE